MNKTFAAGDGYPHYRRRNDGKFVEKNGIQLDNRCEVLILLQEELEGMGTCLEKFGLPSPNMQNRIQIIPRVIQEEMYDAPLQKCISESKCKNLNPDQQNAFSTVMKAV